MISGPDLTTLAKIFEKYSEEEIAEWIVFGPDRGKTSLPKISDDSTARDRACDIKTGAHVLLAQIEIYKDARDKRDPPWMNRIHRWVDRVIHRD